MSKLSEYARQKIEAEIGTPEESTYRANYKNGTLERALNGGALPEAPDDSSETWKAIKRFGNNILRGGEALIGGATAFLGANAASEPTEYDPYDPNTWYYHPAKEDINPAIGGKILDAGTWMLNDAAERNAKYGNVAYQGSIWDRLSNLDYWTDSRGLMADLGEGIGSMLPFVALTAATGGADLPLVGGLLGAAGRGAAGLAAREGALGLLGKAAQYGVRGLSSNAAANAMRYAAFSAPLTAISNAGGIYSDLAAQGYSNRDIAKTMRQMAWEEFPQDILTGSLDGLILSGGIGRLLGGGGRAARLVKNLLGVPIGGAGEYFDELNQQIIQDKYTNQPYGTLLNPTPSEEAAAASAFFPGALFGLGGGAYDLVRGGKGSANASIADDPILSGALGTQIEETNAEIADAQKTALAQQLKNMLQGSKAASLNLPEQTERTGSTDDTSTGSTSGGSATGQAVAVQGSASGAASDATNAKERLWNAILPYAKKYNVDPRLVLAQLSHESANFDSDLARSANNYGGLTTTENTGMPQPDGNMQYARFASPEDFVDHYFKWWGDTIKDSGSDVDAFTSKLKNEGYFGADLGSYTSAVKRHMSSLEKEGYTAAAEAKPVSGGTAGSADANSGGVGYIASGSDAWDGFDGRYVGASSAFSQSNYDNMGKVHPETIAGVNALASEYFKRTGKKLLLNSLAGGSHPSNASEWGHAAGWKADIDNTGVDTKVFLDICEELGIGAALEKDTHFDLSFGKGNAYMSTDQGTSDRTGSRWYEAYHSGKANTSAQSSQSETKRTPPIDINKLFAGIGENSAFGRTFFDAFTRDVGDSTTNENLLVTLEKMKNVRGQFINTKKNREALAAAFPQELQAYAMQLMQAAPEMTKTRQTAEPAPRPVGRMRAQAEAAPRIEEAPMAKSVREALQAEPPKAEALDGGRSLTRAMGTLEESTAPNEPQNTQQAPPSRAGGAESMPQGEYTPPAKGALQGEASAAERGRFQPAGRMQSPAAAMAELQTPGMQPDTHMQQELRLPAEGGHLQPSSKVTMQPAEQPVKRSAALEQRTRPEVQQQSGSVQQGAEMPPMDTFRQQREAAYRAQGAAESAQQAPTAEPAGMQTEPTARQEGQMPTVTPTAADIVLLDAMSPAANAKAGRRHQGRALMQLARKHAVKLPAGVIKLLGEGSSKKAIRAAQQALQAAGVRMPAKEERGHAEKAEQRRTYAAMEEGTAKEHAKPPDEQLRQQETPEEVAAAEAKETKQRAETQKGKKAKGRLGKGLAELLQEDPGEQRKVLNRSLFRGRLSEKTLNESRGDAFRDVVEMSLAAQKAKKTSAETKTRGEETRAEEVKRGEEAPNAQAEYAEARESEPAEGAVEETEARKSEPEEHEPELAKGYRTESGRSLAEADEREFILHPNGSEDFGKISQDISDAVKAQSGVTLQPGKIRLRVGNEKQGLIHANKHIAEAKRAGYDSIEDLVADVAQHFDRIYMRAPNNPSGKTVYSLIKTGNKQANIMNGVTPVYFELQKKGDENYYVVVTAIPKGDKSLARQTKKDRLIYSSPGLDAATAPGDSAVSHDGKAGTVNRGGSPTSDKSSDLSVTSVTQKAEERNGGKGDAVKYSAAMDDAEEAIKSAAKDTRAALDRLADAMGGKVTDGKRAFQAAKDKARFDRAARAFLYAADGNVQALDHVQGVRYSVAWHGSPHTFDTFKLRHIGSGEGAQAHGWGLYFAKGREVAEKYQKRLLQFLPPFRYIYDGKPLSSYKGQLGKILTYFSDRSFTKEEMSETASLWAEHAEKELRRQEEEASMYDGVLSAYKKNPNISIEEMREIAMQDTTTDVSSYLLIKAISDAEYSDEGEPQTAKDVAETLKQQQKKVKRRVTRHRREIKDLKSFDPEKLQYVENKGQLFKVDIPEENVLLDQQKPFNEQPEAVQRGINKIVEGLNDTQLSRWDNIREQGREAVRSSVKESLHDADGQSIYLTLQRILGNAKNVSRALNKYGVKGITYQGWQDGHCYVVFDDQAIKVLEKFSAKGEGAKLRRMLQEATFLKDSELSTQEKKLSALGDAMGIPTVWMDADASLHGFHSDGVTFLNRRSKMHLPQVFWHEAFHYMRANNPKLYSEVVDYIQQSERFTPAQLENYRNKIARLGLSDADTIEEMLADQMHDVGMRVPLLKAMAKENPSLAQRVASWIRRMIDRFVAHFRGAGDKLSERQTAAMARAFSAVMRDMKGSDGKPLFRVRGEYVENMDGSELPHLSADANKKQAADFYQSAGLQLPMEGRKFNDLFGSSIQTEEDLVKMREEHPGKYSAQGESPVKFSAALSDVGAPRRFFDSLARRFGRRAGLKTDKIIVEERARNAKQDMGLSSYLLRSPSRVIKKYPIFLSFFRAGERAYDVLTERRSHFDKRMKEAFAPIKNKKDYADLREVLLAEDSAQKVYTRQELLDSGVKENVIDAHDRVRAMMAEAYEMVNEAHKRPTVKTANGLSDIRLDALKQNKFVRILREAQDADGKYSVTYREYANYERTMTGVSEAALQRMEKDAAIQILKTTQAPDGSYTVKLREGKADLHNIKGYMPHFFHEYMVRIYDKNGKVTATLGSGRTEREAVKVAKDWLKENTLPKDAEIHIAPKMFNWAEAGMDESAFAAVVGDADYFKMRKKIAENTGKTLQEVEEMLDGAVRLKNRHRFFGNAMHRKGVEGYEKLNIGWVLGHYLSSACRYYALETEGKPKMINLYERVFGDFNKDPKTSLAKYTKDFIKDLNGNPSWLEQATNDTLNKFKPWRQYIAARFGDRSALMLASSATGITTQLCLGFLNPSSALLNLTQVINAAAYIGDVSALMRCITRGLHRKYSAEDLRVLKETNVENDIGLDSGAGYDKRRSFGGIKSKLGSISMFPFKLTEGIVRRGTVLTAYKAGRKRGMSHDEAIVYAKDINRKANFDYSAVDAPNIFRRGSIYAQLLLQFKKYGFKEMEVVADMVPVAGDSELTVKQKLLFWTPFLLTGGLLGLPALDLLDWWLDDKFKLKLKKMVLEAGKDSPALDFAGKTALYGLPGSVLGIDVTSRAGLADVVPTSGRDLIGATLSKSTQFAKDFAEGNKAAMIRDFSPALYNYYTAMAGHSEGRRGRTNDTYDTAYDRLLRALGFRSMKESLSSDVSRITTMEKKEASTEKQKAIDDFLEDPSTENARRLQELGIKPQAVETERKKKKETRLERTAGSFSKKEQKAGRRKEIFDLAGEKEK